MEFMQETIKSDQPVVESPAAATSSTESQKGNWIMSAAPWRSLVSNVLAKTEEVRAGYSSDIQELKAAVAVNVDTAAIKTAVAPVASSAASQASKAWSSVINSINPATNSGEDTNTSPIQSAFTTLASIVPSFQSLHDTSSTSMAPPKLDKIDVVLMPLHTESSLILASPSDTGSDDSRERFARFRDSFDPEAARNEINSLLKSQPELRKIYEKLVPQIVAEDIFWLRYFFRRQELILAEEQKKLMIKEAAAALSSSQDSIPWDDDEVSKVSEVEKVQDDAQNVSEGSYDVVSEMAPPLPDTIQEVKSEDGWADWE